VGQVRGKDPNFRTVQNQCTRKRATWLRQELTAHAMDLIRAACGGYGSGIRALTVTASGLVSPGDTEEQLDIFSAPTDAPDRQESVELAMADIRRKHGSASIRLGCYENAEIGTDRPRKH
jgi:hypothetical protein